MVNIVLDSIVTFLAYVTDFFIDQTQLDEFDQVLLMRIRFKVLDFRNTHYF